MAKTTADSGDAAEHSVALTMTFNQSITRRKSEVHKLTVENNCNCILDTSKRTLATYTTCQIPFGCVNWK